MGVRRGGESGRNGMEKNVGCRTNAIGYDAQGIKTLVENGIIQAWPLPLP